MNRSYLQSKLLTSAFLLIAIGIVAVYSSSAPISMLKYGNGYHFLKVHLIHIAIGLLLFLYYSRLPSDKLKKQSILYFFTSFILLLIIIITPLGHQTNGSIRWFKIDSIYFQPSELAKLSIILYSAFYISKFQIINKQIAMAPLIVVILLTSFAIVLEPDYGDALIVAAIGFILLIAAGAKMTHIIVIGSILSVLFAIILFSQSYRSKRISAFLHPWEHSQSSGYQSVQSFIAIGSGGLFGKGIGNSTTKLFYLPEAQTDYILPIISEETGFIGSMGFILIYAYFIIICMKIARRAANLFDKMTALGITTLIAAESLINMMGVSGLSPPKGIVLPFISLGGSSMVVSFIMLGILYRIAAE